MAESRCKSDSEVETLKKNILDPGKQTKDLLDELIGRKLDFSKKYVEIDMPCLVKQNCQSESDIKALIEGLDILSKYAGNLMNPQRLRPQKWQNISLFNMAYQKRVQNIQGHREILRKIGYSREVLGNIIYEEKTAPDTVFIALIYLELKAIHLELKLWLDRKHPYPELFEHCLFLCTDSGLPNILPQYNREVADQTIDCSPNRTLTLENAALLRRCWIDLKNQEAASELQPQQLEVPSNTIQMKRKRESSSYEKDASRLEQTTSGNRNMVDNQSRHFRSSSQSPQPTVKLQESAFLRSSKQEQAYMSSLPTSQLNNYTMLSLSPSLPTLVTLSDEETLDDPLWRCLHCTFDNVHKDSTCRTGSKSSLLSLISPHTCKLCSKTTEVPCPRNLKRRSDVVYNEGPSSLYPEKQNIVKDEEKILEEDYGEKIIRLQREKEAENKKLWANRLLQLVKALHVESGQVPEKEIAYLYSMIRSESTMFKEFNVNVFINKWKALVDETEEMLRPFNICRDGSCGKEIEDLIKNCLICCSGDSAAAVSNFMKDWEKLLECLKEECHISDLSDLDYSDALYQCRGNVEKAKTYLIKKRYADKIWGSGWVNQDFTRELYGNTRLLDLTVDAMLKDQSIPVEKRVRMLMCESDIRDPKVATELIELVDSSDEAKVLYIADFMEALERNESVKAAKKNLMKECSICMEMKALRSFVKLPRCLCLLCESCIRQHFSIRIKEGPILSLICPGCSTPKIDNNFNDPTYFQCLITLLTNYLDETLIDMLGQKLVEWCIKNERVTSCPWNCGERFIVEKLMIKVAVCPQCKKFFCTNCSKKWINKHHVCDNSEDIDHEDLRRCPECQESFMLIRGGCLHVKCCRCSHDFCHECSEPFRRGDCKRFSSCEIAGIHCHHLRNCFENLRDRSVGELEHLLESPETQCEGTVFQLGRLPYHSLPPPPISPVEILPYLKRSQSSLKCQVMVQRSEGSNEEACGLDPHADQSNLCLGHYKEYLYKSIKNRFIDPVYIMKEEEITVLLTKNGIKCPPRVEAENYRACLIKLVVSELPLKKFHLTSSSESSDLDQSLEMSLNKLSMKWPEVICRHSDSNPISIPDIAICQTSIDRSTLGLFLQEEGTDKEDSETVELVEESV